MRLLTLLCDLEVNGNLQSKLQQVVEKESECLLKDNLLQGLLESAALRHCLDTTIDNVLHGKIKVLEVRLRVGDKLCPTQSHLPFSVRDAVLTFDHR